MGKETQNLGRERRSLVSGPLPLASHPRRPDGVPVMRLNHLNLTVPDVPRTREFFETYFGLRCVTEKGRDALAVMVDESGFVLTLNNFEKATQVEYPGAFHVGVMQESRERVDEIH